MKGAFWSTLTLFALAGLLPACGAGIDGASSDEGAAEVTVSRQAVFACGSDMWGCCDPVSYTNEDTTAGFTTAPVATLGHVTTQIMTVGF